MDAQRKKVRAAAMAVNAERREKERAKKAKWRATKKAKEINDTISYQI
jgi:hypothetical protein